MNMRAVGVERGVFRDLPVRYLSAIRPADLLNQVHDVYPPTGRSLPGHLDDLIPHLPTKDKRP